MRRSGVGRGVAMVMLAFLPISISSAASAAERSVTVTGSAATTVGQTSLRVVFSLSATGTSAKESYAAVADANITVRKALGDLGVSSPQLRINNVKTYVEKGSMAGSGAIAVRTVMWQTLIISVDKGYSAAHDHVDAIIKAGAASVTVHDVSFGPTDHKEVVKGLKARAMAEAKESATSYAAHEKVKLGKVLSVVETRSPYDGDLYGQESYEVRVTVTYQLL